MLPHHNQRVGKKVQRHREPAPLHAHHELMPLQLNPLLVEDIHASSLPETLPPQLESQSTSTAISSSIPPSQTPDAAEWAASTPRPQSPDTATPAQRSVSPAAMLSVTRRQRTPAAAKGTPAPRFAAQLPTLRETP